MTSSNSSSNYASLVAKEKRPIFEDDMCGIFLAEPPMTLGHIKIIAKRDGPLENFTDEEAERFFLYANLCASALFEILSAHGTNIIFDEWVRSGPRDPEHAVLHVIARFGEDDFDFFWQPQQLSEPEMAEAEKKIKDKAFMISYKPPKREVKDLDAVPPPEDLGDALKNEITKHLYRKP